MARRQFQLQSQDMTESPNITINPTGFRHLEQMSNLQNNNNRLARYINRVRSLESDNDRLVNIELPYAHQLLGESLRERTKLENLVHQLRNDLIAKDEEHTCELNRIRYEHAIILEHQEIEMGINNDEAVNSLEAQLHESQLRADQLEQMNSALTAHNDELQFMLHFESQRSEGSQYQKDRLQEEMASQMNKYQELVDENVLLDSAITMYDNILRNEEQRLNI